MTDKELLELAAKAAGLELDEVHLAYLEDEQTFIRHEPDSDGISGEWNPLTDDGDALRLAVKLSIRVHPYVGNEDDFTTVTFDDHDRMTLDHNGDALGATRRLITMAAAEIGKGM